MTKVWQFPNGRYYVSASTGIYENKANSSQKAIYVKYTRDIEKAKQFTEFAPSSARPKGLPNIIDGHWVDYEAPLIMTGAEIMQAALDEWRGKSGFNHERESWSDYWQDALNKIKPDRKYKTDGEFSYFEEVE